MARRVKVDLQRAKDDRQRAKGDRDRQWVTGDGRGMTVDYIHIYIYRSPCILRVFTTWFDVRLTFYNEMNTTMFRICYLTSRKWNSCVDFGNEVHSNT